MDYKNTNKKIAVAGCGYWGKNLVRVFAELGVLYAVCDIREEVSESFSSAFNAKSLSWDLILASKEIDAIVISTPAIEHAKMVEDALKAGKHVFVEKPLALSLDDGKRLAELSESLNLHLMVGHLMQYHPAFVKLRQIVKDEKLGKLQYIYSTRLNLGKMHDTKDVVWSFAPHDISMILDLIDSPIEHLNAFGGGYVLPNLADIANIQIKFKNNVLAHTFISRFNPFKEQKFVVICEKAMMVFNDHLPWEEKLKIFYHDLCLLKAQVYPCDPKIENVKLKQEEPLKKECEHFVQSLIKNTTPKTDAKESLNVLDILDKATKSITFNSYNNSFSANDKTVKSKKVDPILETLDF